METNCKVKKMNSIEAFRFIFMLMICIWHYKSTEYIAHGYMAVEFFFILSGLLMYFSVSKPNALGVFDYTLRKMKRFAPDCLFLMAFVYLRLMIVPALFGRRTFDFSWTLQALPESLFLQNTGIYSWGSKFPHVVCKCTFVWRSYRVFVAKILSTFSIICYISYSHSFWLYFYFQYG